ncbi:MAG: hypothetical protein KC912_26210 [Proteobacteria bacterium]|nr:hypothetical protein [Pseudomonadota bacterium]
MFEIGPYTDADDLALYELTELFEGAFRRHTARRCPWSGDPPRRIAAMNVSLHR